MFPTHAIDQYVLNECIFLYVTESANNLYAITMGIYFVVLIFWQSI